jgi:hypothetical protein
MGKIEGKEFLTDIEEKTCLRCFPVAALYNRRENLIKDGFSDLAMKLDPQIKKCLDDLKQWILKNE